jgi:hypothetical protein
MAALTVGALGVVFGDIGTSPLYAMQTVFTTDHHAVRATPGDVYGVISLVFWSIPFLRAPRRSLCAHAVTTRVPRKRASRQACVLDLKAPGL